VVTSDFVEYVAMLRVILLAGVFIVGFAVSGLFNGYALRWVSNPFILLAISSAVFAAAIALRYIASTVA
jgi:hypothetical protein